MDPVTISTDVLGSVQTVISTAVVTGGAIFFALRRRASRDTVEIVKDRAEESVITHLEKQRDRAVEDLGKARERMAVLEAERNDAIAKVSKLTMEVEHLTSQVRILKELVERLGTNLDVTRDELQVYMHANATLMAKVEVLEKKL